MTFHHCPVLAKQVSRAMANLPPGNVIDCTAGGGGHLALLLDSVAQDYPIWATDRDSQAIAHLRQRFAAAITRGRLHLVHDNFAELFGRAELCGAVSGVLADLGMSSPQVDEPERGFSLQHDGPLDMRMDIRQSRTAADVLAEASREELSQIFRDYGEEPQHRAVANAVVERRSKKPFTRTADLAAFVGALRLYRTASRRHPATRIFQALRIEVNGELAAVKQLLSEVPKILVPGGIVAIITFHSLEDRIVKQAMVRWSKTPESSAALRHLPVLAQALPPPLGEVILPFPEVADPSEIATNPRARSAKLRVFRRSLGRDGWDLPGQS